MTDRRRRWGTIGRRVSGVMWAGVWLWPLITPFASTVTGHTDPMVPALLGLLAFIVLYLVVVVSAFASDGGKPRRWQVGGLFVLAALGLAISLGYGRQPHGWLAVLLYVAASGAATLAEGWQVAAWALCWVGVLIWLSQYQHQTADLGSSAFSTLMACALTFVVKKMVGYINLLKTTQEELARAAVTQERLRFARDLHDLLGHTMSVIVVKAEVVRRLADRDPEQVAKQAGDIEEIGRQALAEVREAVTGYRERAFAVELDGARTALSGAGIEVTVHEVGTPLPPEADALFGWAVREGVTNVIRHSGARTCHILVRRDGPHATLEIRDDGGGGAVPTESGNGLRGLAERLAAAGGTLQAEPVAAGGGFRLVARL